jgi:EmrB/QacA subfamily drug resistance transporter
MTATCPAPSLPAASPSIPSPSIPAPPVATHDPRRWLALGVLLTGALLPVLDFNIINLALPAIRRDLGASSSQIQFVISAYAATYAVFLITGGRLGDWLGRKRMFTGGVAGFTLASVLCGTAWSADALIAGRILQGLTATAMAPQVLASIRVLFPRHEQGKALGLYGATFGLAGAVGPVLGGVLVSARPFGLAWQAIFLINVPIGLAAMLGSALFLRETRSDHASRLDLPGVVLLSGALGALVYPLVEGRETGWPPHLLALLALSPLAMAAFLLVERRLAARGGAPLVDIGLFRQRGFAIGVAMALLYYMLSAFYLTISIYLQSGLGLSPIGSSLRIMPFGGGFLLASFASAGLIRRLGPRALTLGFATQVLGFLLVIATRATLIPFELGLAVAGMGLGIVTPSVIGVVISDVDHRHAGLASGIVISTFQIGAALGIAIIGGIFFSVLGTRPDAGAYGHAFAVALGCNVALLVLGGALSLGLPRRHV